MHTLPFVGSLGLLVAVAASPACGQSVLVGTTLPPPGSSLVNNGFGGLVASGGPAGISGLVFLPNPATTTGLVASSSSAGTFGLVAGGSTSGITGLVATGNAIGTPGNLGLIPDGSNPAVTPVFTGFNPGVVSLAQSTGGVSPSQVIEPVVPDTGLIVVIPTQVTSPLAFPSALLPAAAAPAPAVPEPDALLPIALLTGLLAHRRKARPRDG